MTREEFIKELDKSNYSYRIEGNKIVVTNKMGVNLNSLTSLPSGVVFKNGEDVYLGRWFKEWKGNIEGIDSKRLLNVMIKQGVFI